MGNLHIIIDNNYSYRFGSDQTYMLINLPMREACHFTCMHAFVSLKLIAINYTDHILQDRSN